MSDKGWWNNSVDYVFLIIIFLSQHCNLWHCDITQPARILSYETNCIH